MLADVTREDDCVATVAAALERFGGLDILVNNAGRGMRYVSEDFLTQPTRFWENLRRVSTPDFGAGMFAPRSWSLSFGEGVGRIRRRFSFSVIRRPALVPAVSCRVALAIGGARPAPEGSTG